ncbi:ABC transporter permease [Gryllotalpicola daejeonensis]|uniref:Transport permease protein n=1 Tax=Gryllotalpicola daejeonensis TaxID=993087 RepID=A0ABP7ZNA2_9MICO
MTQLDLRAERIANEPMSVVGARFRFFGGVDSIVDIWRHRELLFLLIRREIKSRYKGSTLGVVWSLFRPIAQLLIYYLVIGKVLGVSRGTPDFAIFVFIGLTTWGLYSEIVGSSTTSILSNSGLVKKVYLPREIFPLSVIGSALFNAAIQYIVLIIAIATLSSVPFNWGPNILLAIGGLLLAIVFATVVGLVLAAVNVYLRDVQHIVEIALGILYWASPIVYSFTYVNNMLHGGWLEHVYLYNPATLAVLAMQKGLWAAGSVPFCPPGGAACITQYWPPHLGLSVAVVLLISLALLWPAQRVFARLQGNFAQEL